MEMLVQMVLMVQPVLLAIRDTPALMEMLVPQGLLVQLVLRVIRDTLDILVSRALQGLVVVQQGQLALPALQSLMEDLN
jgi:hypothetical protein